MAYVVSTLTAPCPHNHSLSFPAEDFTWAGFSRLGIQSLAVESYCETMLKHPHVLPPSFELHWYRI